jgi:hypothetical protein
MQHFRPIAILTGITEDEVDPGPSPMLQWIEIENLVVDDAYQRPLERSNWTTIRKIAREFRWSKFSPVFVAPVDGGKFAIIDGQHRTHAAAACGFSQVPCQVVQMVQAEQAAAFAAVNGNVTKVTTFQVLKAALAAGESWATELDSAAESGGCKLMVYNKSADQKKAGEIFCIKAFRQVLARRGQDLIVSALRVLMNTEGMDETPELWGSFYLIPVLDSLCQRPKLFKRADLEEKLATLDLWQLEGEITAENRERQRQGVPTLSRGDQMEIRILEWLDDQFPEQAALAAPVRAA